MIINIKKSKNIHPKLKSRFSPYFLESEKVNQPAVKTKIKATIPNIFIFSVFSSFQKLNTVRK